MYTFSASDCFSHGWDTFKKRPWFMVSAMLVGLVLVIVVGSIRSEIGDSFIEIFAIAVAALVLQTLLDMGLTAFTLKAGDDIETVELSDVWHPQSFWSFIIASFMMGVGTTIGFIFFIIPGIILALAWMFTRFIIIDRDLEPVDAIQESMRITKGNRFELFIMVLLAVGINVLGALLFGIGLFVTIPVTSLAFVRAYRLLEHHANEIVPAQ